MSDAGAPSPDLFADTVPDSSIEYAFAYMALMAPQCGLTFQVTTGHPYRMRRLLTWSAFWDRVVATGDKHFTRRHLEAWQAVRPNIPRMGFAPLPSVHLGARLTNLHGASGRLYDLLNTPAAGRFVVVDADGPRDLKRAVIPMGAQNGHGLTASYAHAGNCCRRFHGLDYVIVNGDSRPADLATLKAQCEVAEVPLIIRQGRAWRLQHRPGAVGELGDLVGVLADDVPGGSQS